MSVPSRGNLQQIDDPTLRRELRGLWESVETMRGERGDARFVTLAELKAVERKIPAAEPDKDRGYTPITTGNSTTTGSSGGVDLLPLDNVWTGQNTFQRTVRAQTPAASPYSSAFVATAAAANTYGYLALSSTGGSMSAAFSAGSFLVSPPLQCQIGFDALNAHCSIAAVRLGADQKLELNGGLTAQSASISYASDIQGFRLRAWNGITCEIVPTGIVFNGTPIAISSGLVQVGAMLSCIGIAVNGAVSATAGTPAGYADFTVQGTGYKIPIFNL